jgi:hypothetical protein
MGLNLVDVISLIEVIFLLGGAFISLQIYTFNQSNRLWLTVPIGFIFMSLRRVILLLDSLGLVNNISELVLWIDSVILPFSITILLFIGMISMYRSFNEFDSLEGQLASKLMGNRKGKSSNKTKTKIKSKSSPRKKKR